MDIAQLPSNNPNSFRVLVYGGAGGNLVLYVSNLLGYKIEPGAANWVAAGLGAFILWIGKEGIKGGVKKIWQGSDSSESKNPETASPQAS